MESVRKPVRPGVAEELLDLVVGEVVHGGWCVAREPAAGEGAADGTPEGGGRVVFVRHALPGEHVLARVTDATARFARADAVQILDASPDRVAPACPHARPDGCGGCDWQHASLDAQRRLKAAVIRQQLRRIAGLEREVTVEPLAGDADGLGWRTRVRFSVGPGAAAGLRKHRSHEVVEVGDCPIAHPLVQETGVTRQHWPGAKSVEVVVSPAAGERTLVVSPAGGRTGPGRGPASSQGRTREPSASRYASWAQRSADSVLVAGGGGRLTALRGRPVLQHTAAGRTWRVGAGVFWQVHPGAADALTAAVLDALRPQPGEVALDLYCGAGLFAGALAAAVGPSGMVIGVESDPAAVRDARQNLRDTPWARVHRGDAAEVLSRGGWPAADIAVLDPPRTGTTRPVVERLLTPEAGAGRAAGGLRRVAYVSCDPATLARDIAVFAEYGWRLDALRAFDAFPMTHHVECLATLERA